MGETTQQGVQQQLLWFLEMQLNLMVAKYGMKCFKDSHTELSPAETVLNNLHALLH